MTLRLFARISAGVIVGSSGVMLAALALGFPSLPPFLPPWSALAFLLLGCALLLEERRLSPVLVSACGLLVLAIGSIIWGQYVFNRDIGFDRLLFPHLLLSTARHPGRPAALTGFHFCLFGMMLLLCRARHGAAVLIRELAALSAATLMYLAFLRYLRAVQIDGATRPEAMTGTAAILGLLAALSVLIIGREGVLIPLLRDTGPAGMIARALMPVPLILPVASTALRLLLSHLGIYEAQTGAAIFASVNILVALGIVTIGARKVFSVDLQRRKAEEELRQSRDELDRRVHLRTRELMAAQAELQHTNAMLGSLIEACPLAICAFDPDGSVRKSNTAAGAMQLSANDDCRKLAADASLGQNVRGAEITCLSEGKEVHLNVWASPILTRDAQPDGVVLIAADVSERKAIEQQMQQAQKLESLGVLAGGIAHDFNNLLTGVLGHASLLRDRLTSSHDTESAQALLDAGERMARLTSQMLAYSGRGRFVIAAVDLTSQVREIASLIQASIAKNVALRLSLAANLPAIDADTSQLQQVIMNLIVNAAEAIGHGDGVVEVATCRIEATPEILQASLTRQTVPPGSYVALVVRDTGAGMDEATKARIFDPFYTTKFAGRGLGLSAVLGIVRAHRGAILVESQPGAGTTFQVLFPVAQAKVVEARRQPMPMSRGRGLVLVVDDEAPVRKTVEAILRVAGYETVIATNGQEALTVYGVMHNRIDAVLLDMTMPVMSGEETLTKLLARWPDAIVIATSGYDESEAQEKMGPRAAGFIQKPYTAAQLTAKIASAIGRKREAGANA